MAATKTMLLVTDDAGRILAMAHVGQSSEKEMTIAIRPLPGQRVQKMEVPEALTTLAGHHLHVALSQARVNLETGKLEFPKIKTQRAKH